MSHILKGVRDVRSDVVWHGLRGAHASTASMTRPHLHPELEFNLTVSGPARYAVLGSKADLPHGRLTVFWGGYPHRLLTDDTDNAVELLWATVPLSAVIGNSVLQMGIDRMLRGEFLYGTETESEHDRMLMSRWVADLQAGPTPEVSEVCLLEMQARLARMATGLPLVTGATAAHAGSAERLFAVIARRYTEDLSVELIAREAGVHPTYAASAFRQTLGMPIWRYVTHLRVAHASRLLSATDWGVERIARASGFQTRSSFYRAFQRTAGTTPLRHRTDPGGFHEQSG